MHAATHHTFRQYPAIVLMECGYIGLFTGHRTVWWHALPTILKLLPRLESIAVSWDLRNEIWQDLSTGRLGPRLKHMACPVSSVAVDATLDFLKIRYHNAMRSTQQHDGSVCQTQITHFQSATFLLSCGKSQYQAIRDALKSRILDMIRDALESNGRGPYQCLRWTFDEDLFESDRTYSTLDDIVKALPHSQPVLTFFCYFLMR
jgi:hypothetical protein